MGCKKGGKKKKQLAARIERAIFMLRNEEKLQRTAWAHEQTGLGKENNELFKRI